MNKQKGLTLLEISFALILSALFLAFSLRGQMDSMRKTNAHAQADQITQIQTAVSDYIEQHRHSIVNGIEIPYTDNRTDSDGEDEIGPDGDNTLLEPSVEQLYLLSILPTVFGPRVDQLNNLYDIKLWVEPIGCQGHNCLVEGMVYTREPLREPGQTNNQYDGDAVISVLEKLGGYGFASYTTGGDLIGSGGSFTLANPVSGSPPGVVGSIVSTQINRDSINPIAGVDYCPGGVLYIPFANSATAGTFYTSDQGSLQDWIDSRNSHGCILQFDDVSKGFSTVAIDADPPKVGWTRVSCSADGQPGLLLTDIGPANKNCNGNYDAAASTTTQSIRVEPGST